MRSRSATPRLARAAGASNAHGAPPPCALARRLRASLGPQALPMRRGPPPSLSLGDSAPRSGRRRFHAHGAHPHALSLGDSAPRSGRRRFSMRMGPTPMRSPLGDCGPGQPRQAAPTDCASRRRLPSADCYPNPLTCVKGHRCGYCRISQSAGSAQTCRVGSTSQGYRSRRWWGRVWTAKARALRGPLEPTLRPSAGAGLQRRAWRPPRRDRSRSRNPQRRSRRPAPASCPPQLLPWTSCPIPSR